MNRLRYGIASGKVIARTHLSRLTSEIVSARITTKVS
jgi:hypothetical protein